MSDSPVNFHRSFAGLLVGNFLAIFVSGLVCIIVWQIAFPDFYQQLRDHLDGKKQQRQVENTAENKLKSRPNKAPNQPVAEESTPKDPAANADDETAKKQTDPLPPAQPPPAPLPLAPEFHLGVWATTLLIDSFFATLAGYLCVLIAGFAHNNHGMLMALFLLVWKVQQLVGFVENQLPASLVLAEIIGLPIACILGATWVTADESNEEKKEESEN